MNIEHKLDGKTLTVTPLGRLDSISSGDFSDFLKEHFTDDMEALVIDFSHVDFISSKGLRVIIAQYKELNGRTMSCTGANTAVKDVFRISGLAKTFGVQ